MRGECSDGAIRLVGGNVISGRLELCINRAWGTICEEGFTADDAQVVCNQTGLPHNGKNLNEFVTTNYSWTNLYRSECV